MQNTRLTLELVRTVDESYPIIIGHDLAHETVELASHPDVVDRRVAIITDSNVVELYGAQLEEAFTDVERETQTFVFPAGEASKTRAMKAQLEDQLIDAGYGRDSLIIALGGGVVTDLAGFIAATYTRGVPYISLSTTLVGAADASVGGKTAIDVPQATNLIGAFHQPKAVLIDLDRWVTLSDDQIRDGLGETIKQACIADVKFFEALEDAFVTRGLSVAEFVRDDEIAELTARRNCLIKRDFVMSDVHEGNRRMCLNLGHTIGRALEAAMGYTMTHGACVAVGMNLQARWSVEFGYMTAEEQERLERLLRAAGMPTEIPHSVSVEQIMAAMTHDKKAKGGAIRFVFQKGIGDVMTFDDGLYARPIEQKDIINFLQRQKERA